jgi:hypothetical protein
MGLILTAVSPAVTAKTISGNLTNSTQMNFSRGEYA